MNTTPEALPSLARRADASYLDFVEGFREHLLGKGADFEERLERAALEEQERRGAPLRSGSEVREFLARLPITHLRDRLTRTQQEMKWRRLVESFEAQRERLRAELAAFDSRGPGRLLLDPEFAYPAYVNVDFHLQPGGYYRDELSGFLYHYGTKVFFRGENDRDELHEKLVGAAPPPADGKVARILDLACSIGQSTTAWKQRVPEAEVWGIDYSAPMLRTAHRRAALLGVDVTFAQRLVEKTGFPDAHFDLVFAFIVFHELPKRIIAETVREAARVLRKGGLFVVYDFNGTESMSPFQLYHRWWDARHNGEPYSQDFCDTNLEQLMNESGFATRSMDLGGRSGGAGYMKSWVGEHRR
jgi:SAM-dependent methyltransferase